MTKIDIDLSKNPVKGISEINILDKYPSSTGLTYSVMLTDVDGQIWYGKLFLNDTDVEWKSLTNITPKL